jgi:hypothetical protein
VSRYDFISNSGVLSYVEKQPYDMLNGVAVLFVLTTVWPVVRRFGVPYGAFIVVNMVPGLVSGGLMSGGRLSSVMFPSFLWLASMVPETQRPGWITVFATMQGLGAMLFYTWRPLY